MEWSLLKKARIPDPKDYLRLTLNQLQHLILIRAFSKGVLQI
jgi:hypothetical protein